MKSGMLLVKTSSTDIVVGCYGRSRIQTSILVSDSVWKTLSIHCTLSIRLKKSMLLPAFIQIPNQQNPACPGSKPRSISQVIHERTDDGSMIRIVTGSGGLEMEWRLMFSFRLKTVWNVSSPPSTIFWTRSGRSRVVFAWQTRHFSTRIFATMQSSEPSHVLKCCDLVFVKLIQSCNRAAGAFRKLG